MRVNKQIEMIFFSANRPSLSILPERLPKYIVYRNILNKQGENEVNPEGCHQAGEDYYQNPEKAKQSIAAGAAMYITEL